MIACIDVLYDDTNLSGRVACVVFEDWFAAVPSHELALTVGNVLPYVPGEFYKRELPCIQAILDRLPALPETIIVDGYVWLDESQSPGLGGHLFHQLDRKIQVVGVAKNRYAKATNATEILRGDSKKPLYITAAGIEQTVAARLVKDMHGEHRYPTLLKRVDVLSRT